MEGSKRQCFGNFLRKCTSYFFSLVIQSFFFFFFFFFWCFTAKIDDVLYDDALYSVLSFLDVPSLVSAGAASKRFQKHTNSILKKRTTLLVEPMTFCSKARESYFKLLRTKCGGFERVDFARTDFPAEVCVRECA